ncbi:MAG: DUF3343 domain-containing protein [Tannerellaceae bacterium]
MPAVSLVATFRTAREVIKADNACRIACLAVQVIAVPERISSECGMCLAVPPESRARFLELMNSLTIHTQLYDLSTF